MSNKSEATWHPTAAPEVPHADWPDYGNGAGSNRGPSAALGDTVPASTLDKVTASYDEALREARAEHDTLARVIEQAKAQYVGPQSWPDEIAAQKMHEVLDAAPSMSLALHDAEVKAQALDDFAEILRSDEWPHEHIYPDDLEARANDIRKEAK